MGARPRAHPLDPRLGYSPSFSFNSAHSQNYLGRIFIEFGSHTQTCHLISELVIYLKHLPPPSSLPATMRQSQVGRFRSPRHRPLSPLIYFVRGHRHTQRPLSPDALFTASFPCYASSRRVARHESRNRLFESPLRLPVYNRPDDPGCGIVAQNRLSQSPALLAVPPPLSA